MASKGIVPKNKSRGVDVCGFSNLHYIIRSDLGLFMQVRDPHTGSDITISKLHPSCRDGEHYFADNQWIYVLKGNYCRKVKNLETDAEAHIIQLRFSWEKAEHAFAGDLYYSITNGNKTLTFENIIDQPRGRELLGGGDELCLKGGLYYWMLNKRIYLIKYDEMWGAQFSYSNVGDFKSVDKTHSIHPNVVNFLPGGLSLTYGPASGIWENIVTRKNDTSSPLKWSQKITRKVGYNREKMSSLEHNWKVAASASVSVGGEKSLVKAQFSVSSEYGGASVKTEKENWNVATEIEETIEIDIEAGQTLHVWQYKLKLGNDDVIFCRAMNFSHSPEPPTHSPLIST